MYCHPFIPACAELQDRIQSSSLSFKISPLCMCNMRYFCPQSWI